MCVSKFVHLLFCQYNVVHRGGIVAANRPTGAVAAASCWPIGAAAALSYQTRVCLCFAPAGA
jgi:hypothetical protein